jgi:hypothetical protein
VIAFFRGKPKYLIPSISPEIIDLLDERGNATVNSMSSLQVYEGIQYPKYE